MQAFHITSKQHSLRLPLWLIVTSEPLLRPVLNQLNHSNQVNQWFRQFLRNLINLL
jgi:hypothetical protein